MNYLGVLEYVGTSYSGFQRLPKGKTVQKEVEAVLSKLLDEKIAIKGAGRTDAGVHALGQTFSFRTEKPVNPASFCKSVNALLPDDIRLLSLKEADESFDARHSCIGKRYEYRFRVQEKSAFDDGRVGFFYAPRFDAALFEKALRLYEGKHDFRNFTTKKEDKDGFVRVLEPIGFHYDEPSHFGTVTLQSNGFMTYQIRFLIGMAMKVADKKMSLSELEALLDPSSPKKATQKAPSCGLYLAEVLYA